MWDEFVDHPMRKDYRDPDDYEWEPTPHDEVMERAKQHYARGHNSTARKISPPNQNERDGISRTRASSAANELTISPSSATFIRDKTPWVVRDAAAPSILPASRRASRELIRGGACSSS